MRSASHHPLATLDRRCPAKSFPRANFERNCPYGLTSRVVTQVREQGFRQIARESGVSWPIDSSSGRWPEERREGSDMADVTELVLRGCSVVDVEQGDVRRLVDVHLSAGVVTAVSPSVAREQLGDVALIDLEERFVSPGLIDMHVHSTFNPDRGPRSEPSAIERAFVAARNYTAALQAGVTSIRDVGSADHESLELKRAWDGGWLSGPRPFVAGQALTAVGGHGNEFGVQVGLEVTGRTEIVRAVRRLAASGVDLIKVIVNGPPNPAQLSYDEVSAAVEAAHACGLRVAAHAQMDVDVLDRAISAGADTIEHGMGITEEQIGELSARGGFLTPTLCAYASVEPMAEEWRDLVPDLVRTALEGIRQYRSTIRTAHDAGVRVLAGTDAGNQFVDFASMHDELRMLSHDCGLGTLAALQAATVHAAAALGRPDLALVGEGGAGDLLILEGNPLEDLAALSTPCLVVQGKNGRSVLCEPDHAELQATLSAV